MSKNDLNDALKDLLPKIDMTRSMIDSSDRALHEAIKPIDLGDPDDFAPNRTAKSAEQMVELLQEIKQSGEEESRLQAKRHKQIFWLTIAVLFVTVIGVLLQLR